MPTGLGDEQLWISATNDNTGTSTAFDDQSGNSNNGTAVGTLVVADTSSGGTYAFDFDGVDDYIDVVSSGTSSSAFTVSLWELSTSSSSKTAFNTARVGGTRAIELEAIKAGSSGESYVHQNPSGTSSVTNTATMSSAWYHVLLRFDGSVSSLYINGQFIGSGSSIATTAYAEEKCWVGQYAGGGFFFQGRVDDIRTYDRALTQAEITHLASSRGVEGPAPVGLGTETGWWSPTLDSAADGLSNLIGGPPATLKLINQFGVVSDTGSGGVEAWEGTGFASSGINTGIVPVANNSFSMSCWFKQDAGATGVQEIMAVEDPSSRDYLQTRTNSGVMATDFNGITLAGSTDLRGGWHHVALTWDSSDNSAKQYIDGVLDASGSMTNGWNQNLGEWEIGSQGRSGTNVWDGLLDDARIFDNHVLTQAEITHLATSRGIEGPPSDPVGLGDEKLWLCPSLDDSANDISGNNNNGTYNGGMGTVTSDGKLCYDFDGANDYITYPIAAIDSANSIGSVSAWIKTPSITAQFGQIIGGSDTASTNAWSHLRLTSGEPTVVTNSSGQVGEKQSSTNVNDSNWHHVCAVGDGSDHSIYVDGSLVSSTWAGTNYGNRWLGYPTGMNAGSIGALVRSSLWGLFEGQMDDIRIYDRAITQAEITHLATSRGIEGPAGGGPPASVFFNPFKSQAFHTLTGKRIR